MRAWLGRRSDRPDHDGNQRALLAAMERIDQKLENLERRYVWGEQLRAAINERRRRVTVILATVVLVLSLAGSILLFLPSMAGPALARDPGRLGIAIIGENDRQAIWVDLSIDAVVEDATTFRLAVSDFMTDHSSDALMLAIYACGQIRDGLALQEVNGGKFLDLKPIDGSSIEFDSRLGERSQCTYAVAATTTRQVLLSARSSASLSSKSGDGIMYALPGLTTLALAEPLGDATATPLPRDSTLTVRLANVRSDFNLTASAPLVPESGRLAWTTSIGASAGIPSQYRVTGTVTSERNRIQAGIFAAGALVGVASAALVWLVELILGPWLSRRAEITVYTDGSGAT